MIVAPSGFPPCTARRSNPSRNQKNFQFKSTCFQIVIVFYEKFIEFLRQKVWKSKNQCYLCTPQKRKTFIDLSGFEVEKINFKIIFQKACLIKNKLYFCTRFDNEAALKKEDTFIDILD